MKRILIIASAIYLTSCSENKTEQPSSSKLGADFSTEGKKVTVYTTADSTDYRLSVTDSSLQFADLNQPAETQVCVFVDPSKTFQTFLGIGGALTDATAETFAKMPCSGESLAR